MKQWALVAVLLLMSAAVRAEDQEVAYLLDWIRESHCIFVRNGDDHSAVEAADHLQMKYKRVRRWIDDADEFVERIASGSSISGNPYLVRCPGIAEQTSQHWLTQELLAYRQSHDQPD